MCVNKELMITSSWKDVKKRGGDKWFLSGLTKMDTLKGPTYPPAPRSI
jgi:hypothetical protein